ncbi:unnamed protein product, partial [Prorocentrum cordatum]
RGAPRRPRRAGAAPRRGRGGFDGPWAPEAQVRVPTDLYQLLGVRRTAASSEIKTAYRAKLKISHPDVAGEESGELMILLNDAYRVLSDPDERSLYDVTLARRDPTKPKVEICKDLGPTWTRSPHALKEEPTWTGTPRSLSKWDKRPPEERGEMWEKRMFAYVDPYSCISCLNCTTAAPHTFLDCISWVEREDLQCLEHVTAQRLFDTNYHMECAMQVRQGTHFSGDDVFAWAESFKAKVRADEKRANSESAASASDRATALEKRTWRRRRR